MKDDKKKKNNIPGKSRPTEGKHTSILGDVDSGTKNGYAKQPMAGSLGKKGKGEADLEAGAGNTDE